MAGVLVLAAGTGRAFDRGDYIAVTAGYLIMRLGLLSLWLRAAIQDRKGRATVLRYATGIAVLEVLWLGRQALGDRATTTMFLVLVVLELLVPPWAERRGPTNWHPHHIAERYALFTIIMLGESVFAATTAVVGVVEDAVGLDLVAVSSSSLVIVAALWWLYFAVPADPGLDARRHWSFAWGYGHYLAFAALAALGAGLEVVVAATAGDAGQLPTWGAVTALAVPVAVAIVMIDLLRIPVSGSPRLRPATVGVLLGLIVVVAVAGRIGLTTAVCLVATIAAAAVAADLGRGRRPRTQSARPNRFMRWLTSIRRIIAVPLRSWRGRG